MDKGRKRNPLCVLDQQTRTVPCFFGSPKRLNQFCFDLNAHDFGLVRSDEGHLAAAVLTCHPSVDVVELFDGGGLDAFRGAVFHHRQGVRMVRTGLKPHHDLKRRLLTSTFAEHDFANGWSARGEGARFVQQDVVDMRHAFKCIPASYDHAVLRGVGKRSSMRNWGGE